MPDASASFLGLCGFSGRDFGLLAGKFDFVQSVWGVFTEFDMVANLLELFAMPCTRVRRVRLVFESHGSGLPVRDSVPLARTRSVCSRGSQVCPTVCVPPWVGNFGTSDATTIAQYHSHVRSSIGFIPPSNIYKEQVPAVVCTSVMLCRWRYIRV